MKYLVALLMMVGFLAARSTLAQTIHYDSAALQHPLVTPTNPPSVVDTEYLFGNPDGNCARVLNVGSLLARFGVGSQEITMQKGSPIHVYWNIPNVSPGDSNYGRVHLQRVSDDLILYSDTVFYVKEPPSVRVEGMATIIVPDTGYNAIGIEPAADSGGNSFWVDAVTIIQSGTAAVSNSTEGVAPLLSSYPNPLEHNSRATVHIASSASGHGILSISDALGREVERISVGELTSNGEDAAVTLDHSGVYFVRLLIDGVPFGMPLKLIAE